MPLPPDVLRSRLKNEIEDCHRKLPHHLEVSDPYLKSFPVTVYVSMLRVPGPEMVSGKVMTRYVHRLQIIITEDYPHQRPIVKWQTPIFHPNIMDPEDGGYVCTKLLERWAFISNLREFISGIEVLLASPNPNSPFGGDSCTRAAQYFREHKYSPPSLRPTRPLPKVIGDDLDG